MKISGINQNNQNFKSILNNKYLLKSLEIVSDHGATTIAGLSFGMALSTRPLAICLSPGVKKENKQYAIVNSFGSGLVKFGIVESVAIPLENLVKKIDKNPEKFLKPKTVKSLQGTSNTLMESTSYKLAAQTLKLCAGVITAIPKSMLTVALIPVLMDKLFNLTPTAPPPESERSHDFPTPRKRKDLNFTGKCDDFLAKGIGKVFNNKYFFDFVIKHQTEEKNIAKHMSAAADSLAAASFVWTTNKNKKINEDNKHFLIYQTAISTGMTLGGGYIVDSIAGKSSNRFIEKFSKINMSDPKLHKYIQGINILRPALIFAGIYYGIMPFFSAIFADKINKLMTKEKFIEPQTLDNKLNSTNRGFCTLSHETSIVDKLTSGRPDNKGI